MDRISGTPPSDTEAWLLVGLASGIGSRYFQRLLDHYGDPQAILGASRRELAELGISHAAIDNLLRQDRSRIESSLAWLAQPNHQLLTLGDEAYPPLLRQIDAPPPLLFLMGDKTLLLQPQLAIVGSRNPTTTGIDNAREFARCLAAAGICITSGLAQGIDGAAHEGALKGGPTIAVMGTGPDRIYPALHKDLAHRIAEEALLITEFPPGIPAKAENFPRRNRIISGLALGTLVVEATLQSGSLITARLSSEQGREVFAIPGSIHNPQARGCHALIRQGAKLVESAQDIIEELGSLFATLDTRGEPGTARQTALDFEADADYQLLDQALGYDPVSVDELIARTGLTAEAVSSMLLLLELEGHVSSAPGGYYCRVDRLTSRPSGRESI
ncbi:MAG: DNA protecting protein DprA [gamma proteobacterium symbiont of Ctena orbiculata]|nr:MAG: DNA protecting protein DprA [gamma proteobacterium symbiont of Ctena orbiculata]PVV25110.1 MAG: DNA protecting protein DprA [gamma proteobacterium symbiont of Ctena orbiculata]